MKLKTKLLIGMLLVSLLPLIVFMGTLFLSHVKETQKLSIEKANYELNFLSSELSGYFSQRMSEIKTYSRSPIIRSMSADRFLPFIKQEISHYPDHFEKFLIARPDGHYYYSNGGNPYIGGLASFDDTNPDARAKSIIKRDYWLYTVGNNHTGTDRSYISNPMISYTTGAKQIVIASSILDQNNTVTGMFGGALPWPNIEKLISQLRDNLNARLPWESRLFLISPAGIYWYHWNPEKVVHLKTDSQGSL